MTDQNSTAPDQNSATEMQYRPEEVQREFNIKSAAYYERIKFLGIKAHKDKGGKVYLTDLQFQTMKRLNSHIQETGAMDGFVDSESGDLTIVKESNLFTAPQQEAPQEIPLEDEDELQRLFRAAAELKGQRLVMPAMVVSELADRLSYDDLPDDVKQKVDRARETTSPKHPSQLATDLLNRYRAQKIKAVA